MNVLYVFVIVFAFSTIVVNGQNSSNTVKGKSLSINQKSNGENGHNSSNVSIQNSNGTNGQTSSNVNSQNSNNTNGQNVNVTNGQTQISSKNNGQSSNGTNGQTSSNINGKNSNVPNGQNSSHVNSENSENVNGQNSNGMTNGQNSNGMNGQSSNGVNGQTSSKAVNDQNCQDQFDAFHECLKKSEQQRQNDVSQQRLESETKAKDQVRQCFSKSNCQEPNFDNFQGQRGEVKSAARGDFEKRRQCSKQVNDKIHFTVEQCAQKTNPNFRSPKLQEANKDQKSKPRGAQLGNIGKAINVSCPQSSQETVKNCMRDVWLQQSAGDSNKRKQIESQHNQSCQAQSSCFKAMTGACQTQFNQLKQTLCDCAQKLDKNQFDEQFNICMGTNTNGGKGSSRSLSESFVTQMCNKVEMCQRGLMRSVKGKNGEKLESKELKSDDDDDNDHE